ncbi:hypothetical protein PLICRDRAFT_609523, partial [Plicaturopsis crispa FD-325 SS-3]
MRRLVLLLSTAVRARTPTADSLRLLSTPHRTRRRTASRSLSSTAVPHRVPTPTAPFHTPQDETPFGVSSCFAAPPFEVVPRAHPDGQVHGRTARRRRQPTRTRRPSHEPPRTAAHAYRRALCICVYIIFCHATCKARRMLLCFLLRVAFATRMFFLCFIVEILNRINNFFDLFWAIPRQPEGHPKRTG